MGQDVMSPEWILHALPLHQINLACQECLQLFLHLNPFFQRGAMPNLEGDQNIHTAVRPKIGPQHGAKKRELGDPPFPSERLDKIRGD